MARATLVILRPGKPHCQARGTIRKSGALRLFRRQLKHVRHSAKLGKRAGFHLSHKVGPMDLHRRLGDAHVIGNLFVEAASHDLDHDLALAGTERVETLSEGVQSLLALSAGTIARKASLDRIEEVLITERLREEFYGTSLHGSYAHRNVAVRGDEDDWEMPVRRGELALKVEAASPGHSDVDHQAGRAIRIRIGSEEFRDR
jgi:hypothetical protein